MNALFVNTHEPACGVRQYGLNLHEILKPSERVRWQYYDSREAVPLSLLRFFEAIVFNWSPLIGGWVQHAPFVNLGPRCRQFLMYHDGPVKSGWDGILFSDPTMQPNGEWNPIGRPVPNPVLLAPVETDLLRPVIGVHGFLGAWADQVVSRVLQQFDVATIRLQLPYSKYCDPDGSQSKSMAEHCQKLAELSRVKVLISHEFLPAEKLIHWLSGNDINCYFRPVGMQWTGVSSAPDLALAARKPIAVNRCNAFRHLHHTKPSITVEDSSIKEIIAHGIEPLLPLYEAWSPAAIRKQVEDVLYSAARLA